MPPEAPDAWADVIRPVPLSRPSPAGTFVPHVRRGRRRRRAALRFLLLVLLPTLVVGGYFFLVAPPRYISETKFLVRKPNSLGTGQMQSLSIDEGPKGIGTDDSYAVRDYLLSRDALALLLRTADLRGAIARSGPDPFWRFPGLLNGASDEDLYSYYLRLVSVDYEYSTGVSTLHVEAFRPEDARRIAETLERGGEALLNRLNERARADAVQVASVEVARTKAAAMATEDTLTDFRTRETVIDPAQLSSTVLTTIGALSLQLVETAAELDVTERASPNSPQIGPLRGRVRAFQAQIDHERATLAGSDMSLAPKIANYERLTLRRDFAERSFISAMNLMEAAQLDVLRQQEYLETVVAPGLPDKARYPYRVLWTLVTFAAGLLLFVLFRPTTQAASSRRRPT